MTFKKLLLHSTILSVISMNAFAADKFFVAPTCLIDKTDIKTIKTTANHLALVQTDEKGLQQLIAAKNKHQANCGGFIDVSKKWQSHADKSNAKSFLNTFSAKPHKQSLAGKHYSIRYENKVNELIKQLNPERMWDNLATFTSSRDRYANSDLGVKAAHWLEEQIKTVAKESGRTDVSTRFVATGGYDQPSLVVKVGSGEGPAIVAGAHMDTLASYWSKKPGADDDGSGSMSLLEAAETILRSGTTFNKPVYFVWYAAEEEGLVGSQYVVDDFKSKGIAVDAVLHFDLTGYAHRNQPDIWIIDDNVDSDLTSFLANIIKTYTKQPVHYTRCGYGCSDHASWTQAGYAAAMPAEARFEDSNPAMHSSSDTMDKLSLSHMTDYAKIGTAFVVELAEPK